MIGNTAKLYCCKYWPHKQLSNCFITKKVLKTHFLSGNAAIKIIKHGDNYVFCGRVKVILGTTCYNV
jgi:hypothetical protein